MGIEKISDIKMEHTSKGYVFKEVYPNNWSELAT